MTRARSTALVLSITTAALLTPAPAVAFNPIKPICGVAGWISGIAGKACHLAQHGDRLLKAGGKLLTGHLGGAAKALAGAATPSPGAAAIGLAAIGAWVVAGARASLNEAARVIARSTRPNLGSIWFSSTYWRMAGLAALLTLPFLFAAAVQAMLRSDLALLVRAAFGYLPLAMLAISVAAPLTMLLLAASDQMSAIVSAAAGNSGVRFLQEAGKLTIGLSAIGGSAFLAFFVGLLTAAGAVVLWLELLIRQAAVYVVVLMLPMAFAALVWPARRVWATRTCELLVALILSKFAIVAVLALAGAALGRNGADGAGGMLTGMVLVALGAFTPWALLRLLPMAELASGAAGSLRGEVGRVRTSADAAAIEAGQAADWAGSVTARMRAQADDATPARAEVPPSDGGRADAALENLSAGPGREDPARRSADAGVDADRPAQAESGSADPHPAAPSRDEAVGGAMVAQTHGTGERSPGMDPIWQAPDYAWRPLELGSDGHWSPDSLWSPEDLEEREARSGEAAAEDHDPLPPKQDPEGGRL